MTKEGCGKTIKETDGVPIISCGDGDWLCVACCEPAVKLTDDILIVSPHAMEIYGADMLAKLYGTTPDKISVCFGDDHVV